jgi:hypothetical protein
MKLFPTLASSATHEHRNAAPWLRKLLAQFAVRLADNHPTLAVHAP